MDLDLRTVRDGEMRDFLGAVSTGFGMTTPNEEDEYPIHLLPAERSLAVYDDDVVVATAGAFPFRIIVPGGAPVAVAGVTVVTVHPTHRRRGLLRQMMDEQLDDVAAPGRAPRRAHRVGGVDLRTLRLRHRDVHDAVGARVGVRVHGAAHPGRRRGSPRHG